MHRHCVAMTVTICIVLIAVPAWAASGYNAQRFGPSIFGGNFLSIEDSHTLCKMGIYQGLYVNYANGPVLIHVENEPEFGILNQLLTTDVLFGWGLTDFLALGVDVPIHVFTRGRSYDNIKTGEGLSQIENYWGFGDIRPELKARLLKQESHWLGLALAPYITVPIGESDRFLGEGRLTAGATLILEHDFNIFNVALNGGYQYRGANNDDINDHEILNTDVGHAIKFGAGLSKDFDFGLGFSVEYFGSYMTSDDVDFFQADPMEVLATVRYRFGEKGARVVGGGGMGLTGGVGSPTYRALGGVDYNWCPAEPTDGDLEINVIDQDGNPITAELKISGPQKFHDNASDWAATVPAGVYEVTAAKADYESDSGSAVVEIEQTTEMTLTLKRIILPTTLKVTVTDMQGVKLEAQVLFDKGTPSEKMWQLPGGEKSADFESGMYKLLVSSPGHESKEVDVIVVIEQDNSVLVQLRRIIVKTGKIYFDYDSDVIRPESYPVLDNVVDQIQQLGAYEKIIIEGHCSSEGSDEYNMRLSQRRADAVKRYLVDKGIPATKLETIGYGESRPIDTNDTEAGKANNRRVEFIIEE